MSFGLDLRGVAESEQVSIGDENELHDWCARLGCTQTQLQGALLAVGCGADDIDAYTHADD